MSLEQKKVLIIEDSDDYKIIFKAVLKKFSAQAIEVSLGQDGITAINNNPDLDLIITDFLLPDITGEEIIEYVSNLTTEKKPKVILVTGKQKQELENLRCKPDFLVIKPFDMSDLINLIQQIFNSNQALSQKVSSSENTEILHFDEKELLNRVEQDQETFNEVVAYLIANISVYIEELDKALASKDLKTIKQCAHKIKGTAMNASLKVLAVLAKQTEDNTEYVETELAHSTEQMKAEFLVIKKELTKKYPSLNG